MNKKVRNKKAEVKKGRSKKDKVKNRKDTKDKDTGGRPSLYKEKYIKALLDYFDIEAYEIKSIIKTFKDGSTEEKEYREANAMPTIAGFARKIKVSRDTINEWSKPENEKKYPGFSDALKRAKDMQEDILVTNGILGLYPTGSFAFTAKNVIGWRDNFGVDLTSKGKEVKANTFLVPCFNDNIEEEATKLEGK